MTANRSFLSGWRLTQASMVALSAAFVGRYALSEGGEESIRAVVRLTAQTSVVLFCAAFAASSLRQLWKTPATAWLLRNRRYIGVSFAYSHLVHLLALVALGAASPEFVASLNATTLIGGGGAYVFIAAMAATSNDRAVAWLGPRAWQRLHKIGGIYVWIIFAQSYLPRTFAVSPVYALPSLLLLATLAVRIAARRQAR